MIDFQIRLGFDFFIRIKLVIFYWYYFLDNNKLIYYLSLFKKWNVIYKYVFISVGRDFVYFKSLELVEIILECYWDVQQYFIII